MILDLSPTLVEVRPAVRSDSPFSQTNLKLIQPQPSIPDRCPDIDLPELHPPPHIPLPRNQNLRFPILHLIHLHIKIHLNPRCGTPQIFQLFFHIPPYRWKKFVGRGHLTPCPQTHPPLQVQIKTQNLPSPTLQPDLVRPKLHHRLHPSSRHLHTLPQRPGHIRIPQLRTRDDRFPLPPPQPVQIQLHPT